MDKWFSVSTYNLSETLGTSDWIKAMEERDEFCQSFIEGEWQSKIFSFEFELETDALLFKLRFG